jgi:hypothetical protein
LQYGCNFSLPATPLNHLLSTTTAQIPRGTPLATAFRGCIMGERRKARRYEVYLPVQVCMSKQRPLEYHTGQLRDVSRTGIFFHSQVPIDSGTGLELTFSLPAERDRGTSVLVRASAKTIRASQLAGEVTPVYGVAAAIDRIDFVRPVVSTAA